VAGRAGAYAGSELPFDAAQAVLDQLVELGALFVTFTGGEVFLYPRFLDLCAAARSRGLGVRILSNGSQIGHEEARRLADLGVQSMELTLYAGSRTGYAHMTGDPGGLRATVRAVRLLQRHEVPLVLKTFYARANGDEAQAIEAVAERMGLALKRTCTLVPCVEDRAVPWAAALTRNQASRIASLLGDRGWIDDYEQKLEFALCGQCGRSRLFVAANGDVAPCNVTRRVVLGNLRTRSLVEIWTCREVQRTLQSLDMEGPKPWQSPQMTP
jgi:pyrroloquinoline quinone biosynthesis protein E